MVEKWQEALKSWPKWKNMSRIACVHIPVELVEDILIEGYCGWGLVFYPTG